MSVEERVVKLLLKHGFYFSSAESCTGGMLMSTLINVPGASLVIQEGFITYSEEAKMKYLHVNKETLQTYGVVSEQTAYEMAKGLNKQTGAQVTVGITGLAGPGGGTEEIPVGTVYVGCFVCNKMYVKHLVLSGDRFEIRKQAVQETLKFLENLLKTLPITNND